MIIRPHGTSQLLITQPDHAALAGRLMREWRIGGLDRSPRRDRILLAVEQHDNGWAEVDAAPPVDSSTGKLLDFVTVPEAVRQGVWPRGVERLAAAPYAAALVAQHAVNVYRRFRQNVLWASFFDEMEARRDRHLRACDGVTLEDLLSDYLFVRVGDLTSLAFCTGWTDVQTDAPGYEIQRDGSRVLIKPDPFAGAEIRFEITAREVPDTSYASSREAADAWQSGTVVRLQGVAVGRR